MAGITRTVISGTPCHGQTCFAQQKGTSQMKNMDHVSILAMMFDDIERTKLLLHDFVVGFPRGGCSRGGG